MFSKFKSRIFIRGVLRAETGLHIGAGGSSLDPSGTDSPVIRDAAGRPFIPGSSFKGALRAHLESLLRGLDKPSLRACDPLIDDQRCIPNEVIRAWKEGEDKAATDDELTSRILHGYTTRQGKRLPGLCDVCKLFGSPWLAARVMIKDFFILEDSWAGRVELRDGVGIDRDTETARHNVKYDFEVVPATSSFNTEIVVENVDDVDLGMLLIGLRECEAGRVSIGGKTTRGLGRMKLEIAELEVIGDGDADILEGEGSADLLEYFSTGKGKKLKGAELNEYVKAKIDTFIQERVTKKG